jgi:hypothetical protein
MEMNRYEKIRNMQLLRRKITELGNEGTEGIEKSLKRRVKRRSDDKN